MPSKTEGGLKWAGQHRPLEGLVADTVEPDPSVGLFEDVLEHLRGSARDDRPGRCQRQDRIVRGSRDLQVELLLVAGDLVLGNLDQGGHLSLRELAFAPALTVVRDEASVLNVMDPIGAAAQAELMAGYNSHDAGSGEGGTSTHHSYL